MNSLIGKGFVILNRWLEKQCGRPEGPKGFGSAVKGRTLLAGREENIKACKEVDKSCLCSSSIVLDPSIFVVVVAP